MKTSGKTVKGIKEEDILKRLDDGTIVLKEKVSFMKPFSDEREDTASLYNYHLIALEELEKFKENNL